MYLDWILIIVAILLIVFLLYAIYHLIQPNSEPFTVVQTPQQQYAIPELKGVIGQYVRVKPSIQAGTDGYMTISQIQVIDINGNNVAYNMPVTATSVGGSPIDVKYGALKLNGNVNDFVPGSSDQPQCITDGVLIPRDGLTSVFETAVQNMCDGTNKNCYSVITTDTEYVEIDLSSNVIISSIIYTGRDDAAERAFETIDSTMDYLTQVTRIKGMRFEIYDSTRVKTYDATLPTTDTVQTININQSLYGVNLPSGSQGSSTSGSTGSYTPLTTVTVPDYMSFKAFAAPFLKVDTPPNREQDLDKSPITLGLAPLIAGINTIYTAGSLTIDLSNNIFLPVLASSPLNFYYDLYSQSGCKPLCIADTNGIPQCNVPTVVGNQVCGTFNGVQQCRAVPELNGVKLFPPNYCIPPTTSTLPLVNELLPVNIFGQASKTATDEMALSIDICKSLFLGSPPAIENFIRVNFSYTNYDSSMKAYLRGEKVNQTTSTSGSGTIMLDPPPVLFCMPDLVQTFSDGSFHTTFSSINNTWNDSHCSREITPTILGLIPFASRNFIVEWVANRVVRYKHYINQLVNNVSYAKKDLDNATDGSVKAQQGMIDAINPALFTPTEIAFISLSAVIMVGAPSVAWIINPGTLTASIITFREGVAGANLVRAEESLKSATEMYTSVVNQSNAAGGVQLPETAIPMTIPSYININSKRVIDTIAQQFYELLGGQFKMSYIYDIFPVGSTMLDVRFQLDIHNSVTGANKMLTDLRAQYARIKNSTTQTTDVLDQAQADYQNKLTDLRENAIYDYTQPFEGAIARLFYTTTDAIRPANNITITGIIFDDRAVTSFIPELNGGLPVPLGPLPGNINYSPTITFTKNQTESLDCNNPVTLRRIMDDYITIMITPSNNYPLLRASPPLDVTNGTLIVESILGVTQLTSLSCSITWTETLYNDATNLPISTSGSKGSGVVQRSATFVYTGDTSAWYNTDITISNSGITFLNSNAGITPLTTTIVYPKPLPYKSNLDNLSNVCPTTSCEDIDVLYSLAEQYNSDPSKAGTILSITHAFTPNANQCDIKATINYDSTIQDIYGVEITDPMTGLAKMDYKTIKKGTVTYDSSSGKLVEGSKSMPYSGVQAGITMALYTSTDPTTCGIILADVSGQNTGTSIQANTPQMYKTMIFADELVKRNKTALGSSTGKLQTDYTGALGSIKKSLKDYRVKTFQNLAAVNGGGLPMCSNKPCSDLTTVEPLMKANYTQKTGAQITGFLNKAQVASNACEATFTTNANATPVAGYKFTFNTTSCSIASSYVLAMTSASDDQILSIKNEMNAAVTEPFQSYRPAPKIPSEALSARGFGLDNQRNSDYFLKDTQFQLLLAQEEPTKPRLVARPSHKFLRFVPMKTRGAGAAAVNVGKFTFYYEGQPLILTGSVTNPMGTWEGKLTDLTGAGAKSGWSDAHKKSLTFAFREPIAIDAYSFTTALPEAGIEGDPVSWKLEGSPNGTFWTALDIQNGFPTPVRRFTELEKFPV